jgi:hypothetical protein
METEINWETVERSRTYLEHDSLIMVIEMLEPQYDITGKNTFWAVIAPRYPPEENIRPSVGCCP